MSWCRTANARVELPDGGDSCRLDVLFSTYGHTRYNDVWERVALFKGK